MERKGICRIFLDIIRWRFRSSVPFITIFNLIFSYIKPSNTLVPSFNSTNRDIVKVYIYYSPFYNKKISINCINITYVLIITSMYWLIDHGKPGSGLARWYWYSPSNFWFALYIGINRSKTRSHYVICGIYRKWLTRDRSTILTVTKLD